MTQQKVIIEEASGQQLRLKVDGVEQLVAQNQAVLQQILEKLNVQTFQVADKIYNIKSIDQATFGFVMDKSKAQHQLPTGLREELFTKEEDTIWVQSLRQALLYEGVAVGQEPFEIFQHFGWLVEVFLLKVISSEGRQRTLSRLAYLVEVFQSSLRYLCFVQLAQPLAKVRPLSPHLDRFFRLTEAEVTALDWSHLLLQTTAEIAAADSFVPELYPLREDILNNRDEIADVLQFMERQRTRLLRGDIPKDDHLDQLLDEYLTALVTWLRRIAFVAKYRIVSIKDIKLAYRLGSGKRFVHHYGELHGHFEQVYSQNYQLKEVAIKDSFTYNHSVLLFKGTDIGQAMERLAQQENYLSLTPFIIDYSVFKQTETHTPDIRYYAGKEESAYRYHEVGLELNINSEEQARVHKKIRVSRQNIRQPGLDELHRQLTQLIRSEKAAKA
ncbi:MAG: hypothetical protein AAGJ82_05460 [Bacteroidota bacterium]